MTKTNQLLPDYLKETKQTFKKICPQPANKSRRWKYTQPDLIKQCFICDSQLTIKYILPKKQYSQKNNWGYWTGRENFKDKYLCDSCLIKIHQGGIINWVDKLEKADVFYTYLSRKTFHRQSKHN